MLMVHLVRIVVLMTLSAIGVIAQPMQDGVDGADMYQGVRPFTLGHHPEEARPIAIICQRLLTMADTNSIFDPGMLLLSGGRVEYAGPPREIPSGYEVLEYEEAWATPGLVDLHSHIQTGGWGDINDMVMPTNTEYSTRPTIVPSNPGIRRACAAGVTTLFGIPGSGTSISGFGVLYKTKTASKYEATVLSDPGGMKVAQTHNPERRSGDLGATRAGLSWLLEEINDRAVIARDTGAFDPAINNLTRIQARELPVLIHCAGNDGVASTARMWKARYNTRSVLSHGSFDGWYAADYVASLGMPVNHGPRTFNMTSGMREGRFVNTSQAYVDAGVPTFSLTTDAPVIPQEEFFLQGTMSAHYGSDPYQMLQALTINPAKSFGIDGSVGSLEVGKNADIVIWSGDPLDPRTRVETVIIDGAIQYNPSTDGQWF
jgi:imidazolonepropionase-like amidohydrolase